MTGDLEFDSPEESALYDRLAMTVAESYGFPVEVTSSALLQEGERVDAVLARRHLATMSMGDLAGWLEDDSSEVRSRAREAIYECLSIASLGDRPEPAKRGLDAFSWLDRGLGWLLMRRLNKDRPAPGWMEGNGLKRTRSLGIALAALFAVSVAACIWRREYLLAIASLAALALFDSLEGSLARVLGMRDPRIRWYSCVLSHLSDLIIAVAIALSLFWMNNVTAAVILFGAAIASIFGSFVRVSALQSGYRFWRSSLERAARLLAFLSFMVACEIGWPALGATVAALLLFVSGIGETLWVLRGVSRLDVSRGVIVFGTDVRVRKPSDARSWSSITDESEGCGPRLIGNLRCNSDDIVGAELP